MRRLAAKVFVFLLVLGGSGCEDIRNISKAMLSLATPPVNHLATKVPPTPTPAATPAPREFLALTPRQLEKALNESWHQAGFNAVAARENWDSKYSGRMVTWTGQVIRVSETATGKAYMWLENKNMPDGFLVFVKDTVRVGQIQKDDTLECTGELMDWQGVNFIYKNGNLGDCVRIINAECGRE